MGQKVREVMTSHPVTLPPDALLSEAAAQMRDQDIGDVLILDENGRLRGIVTDRDIVIRGLADGAQDATTMTIGELASADIVSIEAEADTDLAVQMMCERAVRRIPVVDDGQVIGVISIGDLAIERDPDSALGQISAAQQNR